MITQSIVLFTFFFSCAIEGFNIDKYYYSSVLDSNSTEKIYERQDFSYNYPEVTFTLGVVLSNPNLTDSLMRTALSAGVPDDYLGTSASFHHNRRGMLRFADRRSRFRFQINPVNAHGIGLNRLLKRLFCTKAATGTNALFILVDKISAAYSHSTQLSNMLAVLADHIGLPVIAWSSSVSDLRLVTNISSHLTQQNTQQQMTIADKVETLFLAPSISSQAEAIHAFLKFYHSNQKVTVIASVRTPGYEMFVSAIRRISELEDRRHSIFEFDSHQFHMSSRIIHIIEVNGDFLAKNLRPELVAIRDYTETRIFVVYANQVDSDKIFDEAHHLGMTSSGYVWICGKPSLGDFGEYTPIPHNYLPGLIAVTYDTSLETQLVALKTAVKIWSDSIRRFLRLAARSGDSFKNTKDSQVFSPWIACNGSVQQKWAFGSTFQGAMKRRLSRLLTENAKNVWDHTSNSSRIDGISSLSHIILLDLKFSRQWVRIGNWSKEGGIAINDHKWLKGFHKKHHATDLKKHFLKIATLAEAPYIVYELPNPLTGECNEKAFPCRMSPERVWNPADERLKNDKNGSLICCRGLCMDLLRRLSHDIGFDFELFEVRDLKWGAPNKITGEWNGLVETLMDGTADMVMTSLKINMDRNKAIDFSVPFFETGITILVRVREGMVSAIAFLEPFSIQVWILIFFGCVNAFAFLTFLFEFWHHKLELYAKPFHRELEIGRYSLAESLWTVLCTLFNATGSIKQPKATSTRFISTIWSFVCLILVASFMANLAAFMITKDDYHDFSGVDDYRLKNPYSRNPAWRYSTIPHGNTETILRSNFPDMHEYMKPYMRPTVEKGVESVRAGELDAFIYDASVLEYKAGRDEECSLRTVGKWYALTGYGVGFPKNSKWLHPVNKYIVDYQQSGYLEHLVQYWLASGCKQRQSNKRKSHSLGVLNLVAVFFFLACCIVACWLFLIIEHIFMRHCRRRLSHIDKCQFFATISPKMGAALSFDQTVKLAVREARRRASMSPAAKSLKSSAADNHPMSVENLSLQQLSANPLSPRPDPKECIVTLASMEDSLTSTPVVTRVLRAYESQPLNTIRR